MRSLHAVRELAFFAEADEVLPGDVEHLCGLSSSQLGVTGEDHDVAAGGELSRNVFEKCRDGGGYGKLAIVDDQDSLRDPFFPSFCARTGEAGSQELGEFVDGVALVGARSDCETVSFGKLRHGLPPSTVSLDRKRYKRNLFGFPAGGRSAHGEREVVA